MKAIAILLTAAVFSHPVWAQESNGEQRSNHYLDHVMLGVSDLEAGMAAFRERTGVKPRKDGRNAALGTESAIVGLGDNTFLEIIAPDPKADPGIIDPDLKHLVYDRLGAMDELTPFRWAIGTSNLERTTSFMRRASNRPSPIMAGSRERGWGRMLDWQWARVIVPESMVTPFFIQWDDVEKQPQQRARGDCSLDALHVNSRNYKALLNLVVAMQVDIDLVGSDVDSLSFELDCPAGEVVFDHADLTIYYEPPPRPSTR